MRVASRLLLSGGPGSAPAADPRPESNPRGAPRAGVGQAGATPRRSAGVTPARPDGAAPDVETSSAEPGATLVMLAIIAVSVALDLLFYSGYYASDDRGYLRGAWLLLNQGGFGAEPDLAESRLALVGWNVLVASLFGWNIAAIAASYIFFHQLLNVLACLLARAVGGVGVGLLAMWLMATTPLAVTHSTGVLPDLPLSCGLLGGLLLFQRGYRLRDAGRAGAARRALLLAGVCVGLGYLAKEAALATIPFFALAWARFEFRRPLRAALLNGVALAGGFLLLFAAEFAALSYFSDRPFLRLGWTVGADPHSGTLRNYRHGYYPLERLESLERNVGPWFAPGRLDYALLAAFVVYPALAGRSLAPWFFALLFFAYHTFGSVKLDEYLPPSLQARYFTPVLPVLFAAFALLIGRVCQFCEARRAPWSRGAQAAVALAAVVYPLAALDICDREAGHIYRADIVNPSLRAIEAASLRDDRPIVLSGTVTTHLDALLLQDLNPRIVPAPLVEERAAELTARGFYYVECGPRRRLETVMQADGFDPWLHPVVLEALVSTPESAAGPYERDLGSVSVNGVRGDLRVAHRCYNTKRRTEQVAHLITPLAAARPDLNRRMATVFEWTPRAAERAGSRPADAGPE